MKASLGLCNVFFDLKLKFNFSLTAVLSCFLLVFVIQRILSVSVTVFLMQPEFCSLTHLVKLDLSKNQLTCLPDDLGNLVSLQHLDLYNNKLTVLPVSFSQLRVSERSGTLFL